jgi:hypothetical protein
MKMSSHVSPLRMRVAAGTKRETYMDLMRREDVLGDLVEHHTLRE